MPRSSSSPGSRPAKSRRRPRAAPREPCHRSRSGRRVGGSRHSECCLVGQRDQPASRERQVRGGVETTVGRQPLQARARGRRRWRGEEQHATVVRRGDLNDLRPRQVGHSPQDAIEVGAQIQPLSAMKNRPSGAAATASGRTKAGLRRRSVDPDRIAVVAPRVASSGDGGDDALRIDATNHGGALVDDQEAAIRHARDGDRGAHAGLRGRTAVSRRRSGTPPRRIRSPARRRSPDGRRA